MRILIVDDEPAICRSLRRVLEPQGHVVVAVVSADEAIALFRAQSFDVALIDYELGSGKTGLDVAQQAPRSCALIMVTGHSPEEMRPKIEDPLKGFLAIVGKPFDGKELLVHIKHAAASKAPKT